MANRIIALLLGLSSWIVLSGASTDFDFEGQEEGGIGGTGIMQNQAPDDVFEPPEMVESIEDSIPDLPEGINPDIPDSPETPQVDTPE
ncbi:MAG: hypothetical protein CSA52_01180 [Gammaproteobacteria bacterium]|nr:MAG: hypothetical protein CSB48_13090 [Pseudomonadota bacterium]PIE38793.1 MAG: hypothetical protein CSA52_01180 [Gammaproteobacteria bacterium]